MGMRKKMESNSMNKIPTHKDVMKAMTNIQHCVYCYGSKYQNPCVCHHGRMRKDCYEEMRLYLVKSLNPAPEPTHEDLIVLRDKNKKAMDNLNQTLSLFGIE
jgi:hypothetical protein